MTGKGDEAILPPPQSNSKPFLTGNYCTQSNNLHCDDQCANKRFIQIMQNLQTSGTDSRGPKTETINAI